MQEQPKYYKLHSTSRSRHTRSMRASTPGSAPALQWVCGQKVRLLPGADVQVPESMVLEHLEELKAKRDLGYLTVLTQAGQVVDLDTLTPAPLPTTPLEPTPPVAKVFHYVGHDKGGVHPDDRPVDRSTAEAVLDSMVSEQIETNIPEGEADLEPPPPVEEIPTIPVPPALTGADKITPPEEVKIEEVLEVEPEPEEPVLDTVLDALGVPEGAADELLPELVEELQPQPEEALQVVEETSQPAQPQHAKKKKGKKHS